MSFTLLSDREIKELCTGDRPMLSPFIPAQVKEISLDSGAIIKAVSYGTSSYGYDLRLAPHDFRIFKKRNILQKLGLQKTPVIDPKNFGENLLYKAKLRCDRTGEYFALPPHSTSLGVAIEQLDMPDDVIAIANGKTTYARCGVNPFVTSAKAGWNGYLMLEFANNTDHPCRIYANEGVCELVFLCGSKASKPYDGLYQGQSNMINTARV